MGYLNSATITVDAIVTKHGRKLLSEGKGLGISSFALSDDMVDYNLWNPDHVSGSAYYGEAIENLPMLEAVPDDSAMMKYKLTTLDRNTVFLPMIRVTSPLTLATQNDSKKLSPNTENGTDSMYQFLFTDISSINVLGGKKIDIGGSVSNFLARGEIPQAAAYNAKEIKISAKITDTTRTIQCQVTGIDTGAVAFYDITIEPNLKKLPTT